MNDFEHEWDLKSVDFPIGEGSAVFDVGAFKGRWSSEMARRYPGCRIYAFEPQPWAMAQCEEALRDFPGAEVFNFGLGDRSGEFEMEEWETDGCTFLPGRKPRRQVGVGQMVEINSFLHQNRIRTIDVCMMNIEGYEFVLIPHMLKSGIFDRIKYFECQFHPSTPEEIEQMGQIRDQIYKRMDYFFDYGATLTCWRTV